MSKEYQTLGFWHIFYCYLFIPHTNSVSCHVLTWSFRRKSLLFVLFFFAVLLILLKRLSTKDIVKGLGWGVFKRIEKLFYKYNLFFYASMWIFFSIVNPFFVVGTGGIFNFHCFAFIFYIYHWWQIWPIFHCNKKFSPQHKTEKALLVSQALHIKKELLVSKNAMAVILNQHRFRTLSHWLSLSFSFTMCYVICSPFSVFFLPNRQSKYNTYF